MWISVVPGGQPGEGVILPPGLWPGPHDRPAVLRFGAGEALVQVRTGPPAGPPGAGRSQHAPAPVVIAPDLMDRLCIRPEPVYRLRRGPGLLEIGPVLGLVLGNRNHWYDNAWLGRESERVTEVYPRTGGLVVAFSPRNVSMVDGCAYGLFYAPGEGRWRYGPVPLPTVAHRRSFHADPGAVARLRHGAGVLIFNSRRFDKWQLHRILQRDPTFAAHLPETRAVAEGSEVVALLERHGAVVLKPADLSRGRGILFADGHGPPYRLTDCRQGGTSGPFPLTGPELAAFLAREVLQRRYVCQQRIDLARIDGAPFDVRVVMQRSPRGQWCCHGIECRLARPGLLVTNIAFGGRPLRLDEAVPAAFGGSLSPAAAEGRVVAFAERLCHLLDQTGETFAEFGVDIALDRGGRAWLIEANVLPTFKGFQALDPATYRRLLAAPLLYANYLAGFGEEDLGANLPD